MKHIPETVVQQSIYIDFNNKYCLKRHEPRLIIYAVTNGFGINLPKEMPAYWVKIVNNEISKINQLHVKLGMLAGVSDLKIEGMYGRVLSVEVKTETDSKTIPFADLCVTGGIVNAYDALKLAAEYKK